MEAYGLGVRAWGSMTDGGPCIRYGAKKIEKFFFVSYALKMILNGFWTCFGDFWFSRSPNPLHDPCIRYGAKKIEKFFFVSYALKMILNGFWTCFGDFCFSRSPNPLHVPCIRYGRKKSKIFFLILML
jgi:hypothetical protein